MRVVILNQEKEVIDEAVIRRVGRNGHPSRDEIEVESLMVRPGEKTEFAFVRHRDPRKEGWRMLLKDPLSGVLFFGQRASTYTFEPA